MASEIDIYEEYPELRNLTPRRPSGRKTPPSRGGGKGKMSNSAKLVLLIVVIAAVVMLAAVVLPRMAVGTVFVYAKDGTVLEVDKSEYQAYIDDGYYPSPSDLVSVSMYAQDATVAIVRSGDVEAMEKKGFSTDISSAYTTMYRENGETLYVPNSMADSYKANGWFDKLSDVVSTLYKEDGSSVTVMKSQSERYLSEGYSASIYAVAKLMISPEGEEKTVFNNQVNEYLDNGWTIVKRVVDPQQPMVALTFDDGPGKYTDDLLSCLEENNSAATFFVLGSLTEQYPDAVKRASSIGCEIANHTWDHENLTSLSAQEAADTLKKTSDAVEQLIGKGTALYRPPYGAYNETVLNAAPYPAIIWSLDTLDWKTKNADSTYEAILNNVCDGSIVLMHDIHQPTVEAAKRVIPQLIKEGYQLVTVSELLEYRLGGAENGKVYFGNEK